MSILRFSLVIITLGVWTGCTSLRETLDSSLLEKLHTGQNRAEVLDVLGPPNSSAGGANGKTVDHYIHDELVFSASSAASAARDLKIRSVSVRYNASGKVERTLTYDSRTPAAAYRTAAYAGRQVNPLDISKIKIGTTTRRELEQMFQSPVIAILHPVGEVELHWIQIEVGTTFTHLQDVKGLHVIVDDQSIVRWSNYTDTSERR